MEIDLKTALGIFAHVTLFLLMLAIGLKEEGNFRWLWKRPSLLIRCLIASFLLVPLAAMAVGALVPMGQAARLGMGTMAICPGAPMLYRKLVSQNANSALAGSFQVTTSLFAILIVPLWLGILSVVYSTEISASMTVIAKQIAFAQLIPILLGLSLSRWIPKLAEKLMKPVEKISSLFLLVLLILILIVTLPKVADSGWINLLGVVLFVAAMIGIGHFLGGGDPETRISVALANSTRNAGLALALVSVHLKDSGSVLGTIAAIALLAAVAGAIYTRLYRKRLPDTESPGALRFKE